jgi:glycerol-3-phosphate acyltransferase PlsY
LWPVFFRFQGGKGVATAAGVLLGINPWLGLATLLTWLIIAAFFRYSSLASIVSAVFAPFYQLLIWGGGPAAIAITVMGLLLIWRHTANIRKLLEGTESKLGHKAPAAAAPAHAAHPHPGTRRDTTAISAAIAKERNHDARSAPIPCRRPPVGDDDLQRHGLPGWPGRR